MARRNDISRDGKAQRGYRGVRILPTGERAEGADVAPAEEGGGDPVDV